MAILEDVTNKSVKPREVLDTGTDKSVKPQADQGHSETTSRLVHLPEDSVKLVLVRLPLTSLWSIARVNKSLNAFVHSTEVKRLFDERHQQGWISVVCNKQEILLLDITTSTWSTFQVSEPEGTFGVEFRPTSTHFAFGGHGYTGIVGRASLQVRRIWKSRRVAIPKPPEWLASGKVLLVTNMGNSGLMALLWDSTEWTTMASLSLDHNDAYTLRSQASTMAYAADNSTAYGFTHNLQSDLHSIVSYNVADNKWKEEGTEIPDGVAVQGVQWCRGRMVMVGLKKATMKVGIWIEQERSAWSAWELVAEIDHMQETLRSKHFVCLDFVSGVSGLWINFDTVLGFFSLTNQKLELYKPPECFPGWNGRLRFSRTL